MLKDLGVGLRERCEPREEGQTFFGWEDGKMDVLLCLLCFFLFCFVFFSVFESFVACSL